eukprot:6386063-Pyramimonas_sp.AAC.1
MVATLTPRRAEPAQGWAYMDDRSLTAGGVRADQDLAEGLAKTQAFDKDAGFVENSSKRQFWEEGKDNDIEHLG